MIASDIAVQFEQPALLGAGERVVTTKTGRTVIARLIGEDDAPLLVDLYSCLSERTRWLRFSKPHGSKELAWREATRLIDRDGRGDTTLVGVVSEGGEERAVALILQLVIAAVSGMAIYVVLRGRRA